MAKYWLLALWRQRLTCFVWLGGLCLLPAVACADNSLPVVALTEPVDGMVLKVTAHPVLTAAASDADGRVVRVEFFAGTNKLGEATNEAFSMVLSNLAPGLYLLTAVATDNDGGSSTSAPVSITLQTNKPPSISISQPLNSVVLGGPLDLTISASASDLDGAIVKVEFYASQTKLGEKTDGPFSLIWSNAPLGAFSLVAVATDDDGFSVTSAPVAITIYTNLLPSVTLTAPKANAIFKSPANITLTCLGTDPDGTIKRTEYFAGSNKLGERIGILGMVWNNASVGSHLLRAVVTDSAGGCATSPPVSISVVTNLAPSVALTNPVNNAVLPSGSNLWLRAGASDADGGIARVDFYLGATRIGLASNSPYACEVANLLPGSYLFRAVAWDTLGQAATSAVLNVTWKMPASLLVATGSVWKYLDTGANLGAAWRAPGFDDRSWTNGRAQLGYGDSDEAAVVGYGPDKANKYPTTYFRRAFAVTNAAEFRSLKVRLLRDDGGVVYLNGAEVFRSNMTNAAVDYRTLALAVASDDGAVFYAANVDPALLVEGTNVLAVEIHQAEPDSSDLSFDLELSGLRGIAVTRGPYLQRLTATNVVVRWRTSCPTASRVAYGTNSALLDVTVDDGALTTEHIVALADLLPGTQYFYAVGTPDGFLAGGVDCALVTAPAGRKAEPTRIWMMSDSGHVPTNSVKVRDAFYNFTGLRPPEVWLASGDLAQEDGTDEEYQAVLFDLFPVTLKQTALFPALGNHDTDYATNPPITLPYFLNFTVPTNGEAGGWPSGTPKYYSFNYANIHFVCLDAQTSDRSSDGPMLSWLRQDLAVNSRDWLIAFWHQPPYGKRGNDSDTDLQMGEMRSNAVPILEAFGADLVLGGHDHGYERSYLLDGHYGVSSNLMADMILRRSNGRSDDQGAYDKGACGPYPHRGTVYVVAGVASKLDDDSPAHPAMYLTRRLLGSVYLEVGTTAAEVKFLREDGTVEDQFTILKNGPRPTNALLAMAAPVGPPGTNGLAVRQSGLFFQNLRLSNDSLDPYAALRVIVSNLPPAVKVFNAAGTLPGGLPYLLYNQSLLPGQSVDLRIEYYVPDRKTVPNPALIAEVIAPVPGFNPAGAVAAIERLQALADGTVMLELHTLANRAYHVQYSSDLVTWQTAFPPIVGTGSSVQWLDYGLPKTQRLGPECRYYRVILAP